MGWNSRARGEKESLGNSERREYEGTPAKTSQKKMQKTENYGEATFIWNEGYLLYCRKVFNKKILLQLPKLGREQPFLHYSVGLLC